MTLRAAALCALPLLFVSTIGSVRADDDYGALCAPEWGVRADPAASSCRRLLGSLLQADWPTRKPFPWQLRLWQPGASSRPKARCHGAPGHPSSDLAAIALLVPQAGVSGTAVTPASPTLLLRPLECPLQIGPSGAPSTIWTTRWEARSGQPEPCRLRMAVARHGLLCACRPPSALLPACCYTW